MSIGISGRAASLLLAFDELDATGLQYYVLAFGDVLLEIAMDLIRSTVGRAKLKYPGPQNVNTERGDLRLIGNGELCSSYFKSHGKQQFEKT